MKPIRLSIHALGYTERRGFTPAEVEQAIRESAWQPADRGEDRQECRMEFAFNAQWNGRFYTTKQIRPIFVETEDEILVVTVYAYYY